MLVAIGVYALIAKPTSSIRGKTDMKSRTTLEEVIGGSKFKKIHLIVLLWCISITLFDGYELAVFGSALPEMITEWGLTPVAAGAIGSYGTFGMLLGALIMGPLADKIGNKRSIIGMVFLFSLFQLLCGLSSSVVMFSVFRFIAGFGLGGVLPNVLAIMSGYSPKHLKGTLVTMAFVGMALGFLLGTGMSILTIPAFGWRSVFLIGGLPLLVIPFMMKYLPESPSYLLVSQKSQKLLTILQAINPATQPEIINELTSSGEKHGFQLLGLFKEGRGFSTVMFWIACFMSFLTNFGIVTWLTKFMVQAGYPLASSLEFMVIYYLGCVAGTLIGAWISDRLGMKKAVVLFFTIGGLSLTLLIFNPNLIVFNILIFLVGIGTFGSQSLTNAFATNYYPENLRSTGAGMALGLGRLGAVFGPTYGGLLLSLGFSLQMSFLAFAVPSLIAALALSLVSSRSRAASYNLDQVRI